MTSPGEINLMNAEPGSDVGGGPPPARPQPAEPPGDPPGGWLKAGAQPGMEAALSIAGGHLPAAVDKGAGPETRAAARPGRSCGDPESLRRMRRRTAVAVARPRQDTPRRPVPGRCR